jgi:uncharacterized membrane protein YfcA
MAGLDTHFLAAVAGIYLLAGAVKGVIGMGLPTVAMGLLGLTMAPAQAAAVMVVPSLVTNVWQGLSGGAMRELLGRLWPLIVGEWLGTAIGAVTLPHGNGSWATPWLGAVLAVYAALGLLKLEFSVPKRAEGGIGFSVGMATGFVAVVTGVFTIPALPFIQALGLERDKLVQALGLFFTTSTAALAVALYHANELTLGLAGLTLLALLASLLGMPLGQLVRRRISPRAFRLCFFVGLLLLGLRLALRDVI